MTNNSRTIIEIKLTGEIYSNAYSLQDLEHLVRLFNDIHGESGMKLEIIEAKEIQKQA